jgi:hypothetical protein
MMPFGRFLAVTLSACLMPAVAHATKPKLETGVCTQLRMEATKARQSGVLADMSKGPAWAKANLSAARLREVAHYLELNEQIQFGCRDAKLSADAQKASEAAARIEVNSDADPIAASVKDPAKPGSQPDAKGKKSPAKATHKHKKAKPVDPKSGSLEHPEKSASTTAAAAAPQSQPLTGTADASSGSSSESEPTLPAFGFGETVVLPFSASE